MAVECRHAAVFLFSVSGHWAQEERQRAALWSWGCSGERVLDAWVQFLIAEEATGS